MTSPSIALMKVGLEHHLLVVAGTFDVSSHAITAPTRQVITEHHTAFAPRCGIVQAR